MAYEIKFTDELNKGSIILEDATLNTDTSLRLIGRNTNDFGEALNENLLRLMENFANNVPPLNPVEGQLWYDTTANVDQLKIYDGTNWVAAGGLKKASSQPEVANSVIGDLWVDTTNSQLYIYTGSGWILVGPEYSNGVKTGALAETLVSTDNLQKLVVINYINDIPIAIIADSDFTPNPPITGFGQLVKGINLATTVKLNGTATNSQKLDNVDAVNFPQLNKENIFTKKIRIRNNSGIEIGGTTSNVRLSVNSSDSILEHLGSGTFDFKTIDYATPAIRINASIENNVVGINNLSPDEALDVIGNIKTSGQIFINANIESTSASSGSLLVAGGAGFTGNVNISGTVDIDETLQVLGNLTTSNILPTFSDSINIGTSTNKFNQIYANIVTADLVGNISGKANSADKLSSPTLFSLTGDVSSNTISFNGQQSGNLATFTTSISNNFIADKDEATVTDVDDYVLTYRESDNTLYKQKQSTFLAGFPVIPVGTVVPFAGVIAPPGWKICNGEELSLNDYGDLADVLGYNASDNSTYYYGTPSDPNSVFKIPDLRGRNPVGINDLNETNRITTGADTLGNVNGNQFVSLTADNLPDHTHDLQGETNDQFYAVTNASVDDGTAGGATDGAAGRKLDNSGGITGGASNTPFDVSNPYVAMNYIIYTGVIE